MKGLFVKCHPNCVFKIRKYFVPQTLLVSSSCQRFHWCSTLFLIFSWLSPVSKPVFILSSVTYCVVSLISPSVSDPGFILLFPHVHPISLCLLPCDCPYLSMPILMSSVQLVILCILLAMTQEVAIYLIRLSQKSPRLEHPCVCSCTSNQLCINLTCALAAHAPSRWTHVPLHLHLFPEEPRVCASTSWLLPPRIWPMAGLWRQYRRWRSSKHGCARASASPSELHKCAWVWNSCSRFSPPPLWFSISHTHVPQHLLGRTKH